MFGTGNLDSKKIFEKAKIFDLKTIMKESFERWRGQCLTAAIASKQRNVTNLVVGENVYL